MFHVEHAERAEEREASVSCGRALALAGAGLLLGERSGTWAHAFADECSGVDEAGERVLGRARSAQGPGDPDGSEVSGGDFGNRGDRDAA